MFSFAKKFVDRFEAPDESKSDSYFKSALSINNKGYGLRVLAVVPHLLAHTVGFESWFDYVIRINGQELPMMYPSLSQFSYSINDDGTINYGGNTTADQAGLVNYDALAQQLVAIAKSPGSKTAVFDVWSAKGGVIRQVRVPLTEFVASTAETGVDNLFAGQFEQIGLTVQSQHLHLATYVWRILNTHTGSPAFQAQLAPYSDYIIGCDSAYPDDVNGKGLLVLGGEALLSRTVLSYYNHHYARTQEDNVPITLYVYNHDYDILRPVTVNLSRSWGSGHNRGILGCDVGYGLLHRIPEVIGKFGSLEILDDVLFESSETFQYQAEQPPPDATNILDPMAVAPPPKAGRKKKPAKANVDLSNYMNEELNKSKEHESPSTTSEAVPPPPKAST